MIARTVHNHIPAEQLNNDLFKMYEVSNNEIEMIKEHPDYNSLMDIDVLPIYALP